MARRRTSCGRCARSWARSSAATPRTSARRSTPAATGSPRRSTTRCSGSSRSGSTPRRSSPTSRTPTRCSRTGASPPRVGLDQGAPRAQHPQRAWRRHRLPHGRGARLRPAPRRTPARARKKFQPQFDVLGDGWRQPGSSIKPLVYLIGIEDRTMTASTMFMDVVTNFAPGRSFVPDPGRRPRARPRPAAQRAPVLAQHPGDQGRARERPRPPVRADAGLRARLPQRASPRSPR